MTKPTIVMTAAGVLVLVAGLGSGLSLVAAQGTIPAATASPQKAEPDEPPRERVERREREEREREQREVRERQEREQDVKVDRIQSALKRAENEIAAISKRAGVGDLGLFKNRLEIQQQRLTEMTIRVRTERPMIPPELEYELQQAERNVEMARQAPIPPDILAAALRLNPRATDLFERLEAIEKDLRAGEHSPEAPERKKLNEEREAVRQKLERLRDEVGPEIAGYIRTPGVVEAEKKRQAIAHKVMQFEREVVAVRKQLELVDRDVAELKAKIAELEPVEEELEWLKEKRKLLKMVLMEMELRELGVGK